MMKHCCSQNLIRLLFLAVMVGLCLQFYMIRKHREFYPAVTMPQFRLGAEKSTGRHKRSMHEVFAVLDNGERVPVSVQTLVPDAWPTFRSTALRSLMHGLSSRSRGEMRDLQKRQRRWLNRRLHEMFPEGPPVAIEICRVIRCDQFYDGEWLREQTTGKRVRVKISNEMD